MRPRNETETETGGRKRDENEDETETETETEEIKKLITNHQLLITNHHPQQPETQNPKLKPTVMYIQQLTSCLAEAAYYIESNGEAAIIDPLRETGTVSAIGQRTWREDRMYVLETHFHADFVSGHIDLARLTGAKIVYWSDRKAEYDIYVAQDGEDLPLGNVKIRVLHTPGHTLESSSFLLLDEHGTSQLHLHRRYGVRQRRGSPRPGGEERPQPRRPGRTAV